ncbi:MAG: hypothetical protein OXE86_00805 [Alphaproteobacteria bacterium]|nr:hypothetical protein [Alphaproteobacteria bacterium]
MNRTVEPEVTRSARSRSSDVGQILKEELSALRIFTLAAITGVLAGVGGLALDDPWAPLVVLWFVGASWTVIAGMAPVRSGSAPHLARLLASMAFPVLITGIGAVAMLALGRDPSLLLVAGTWTIALPVAIGTWRNWRDNTAPARIVGTSALVLLAGVHVALALEQVRPAGLPSLGDLLSSELRTGLFGAGLLLLAASALAPGAWRSLPGLPVFTVSIVAGGWALGCIYGNPGSAWLVTAALAYLVPCFSGAPRRAGFHLAALSPPGAAVILSTAAALVAAIRFSGIVGEASGVLFLVVQLYVVRDIVLWRIVVDLTPGERVRPAIWVAWICIVHGLGQLAAFQAPPGPAPTWSLILTLPLLRFPDLLFPGSPVREWEAGIGALLGLLAIGVVALLLARRRM